MLESAARLGKYEVELTEANKKMVFKGTSVKGTKVTFLFFAVDL